MTNRVAAALVAWALSLGLGGCGFSTLNSEQYAMKGSMSTVVFAVEERQRAVDAIASTLESAGLLNTAHSDDWSASKHQLRQFSERFWTNDDNDTVAAIDAGVTRVSAMADAIVRLAASASHDHRLGKSEATALLGQLHLDERLRRNVETAKHMYNLGASNYNQILSIAPAKWGAMLLGVKPKVMLHTEPAAAAALGASDRPPLSRRTGQES